MARRGFLEEVKEVEDQAQYPCRGIFLALRRATRYAAQSQPDFSAWIGSEGTEEIHDLRIKLDAPLHPSLFPLDRAGYIYFFQSERAGCPSSLLDWKQFPTSRKFFPCAPGKQEKRPFRHDDRSSRFSSTEPAEAVVPGLRRYSRSFSLSVCVPFTTPAVKLLTLASFVSRASFRYHLSCLLKNK
jgi:hypothetical protein